MMTDKDRKEEQEEREEHVASDEKRKPGSQKFAKHRILSGSNQPTDDEQKKDKSSGSEFKDQ